VTGTSKSFVYDDYIKQLKAGDESSASVLASSLAGTHSASWHVCSAMTATGESHLSCTDPIPGTSAELVAVHNPLGWRRSHDVSLVVYNKDVCVTTPAGAKVVSQLHQSADGSVLTFRAEALPPFGVSTFVVAPCSRRGVELSQDNLDTVQIENDILRANFSHGHLVEIFDKASGVSHAITCVPIHALFLGLTD
jgi:hypothetical protein